MLPYGVFPEFSASPFYTLPEEWVTPGFIQDEEQLITRGLEILRCLIINGHVNLEAAGVHETHDSDTRQEFIRTHIDVGDWQPGLYGQFHVYYTEQSWRVKWRELPINPETIPRPREVFIEETQ